MKIINRCIRAEFSGEHSVLDYHISGSQEIIQEIDDALRKIEDKYPKMWEKETNPK